MEPVFEYLNYREYLGDYFAEKKAQHSFYSCRLFSQKMGFKSPNFMKLVIESQRNLTKDSVFKITKGLKFNKKEAEYFENLVFFNQSKSLDEKNFYLKSVLKFRKQTSPHKVEKEELKYFTNWYHPVIRELVCAVDFSGDYKKLGKSLIPAITADEAKRSVKLLVELGYITQEKGQYCLTSTNISTGPQIRSVAVSNYHREMISLASESIERFPAAERNITSLTLSLSKETSDVIVKKIEEFRKELLMLAEADKCANKVTQINFQLFPLSDTMDKEADK
ncbi:MAG: TIGR02147 family protein [Fibrobacteria bacterium]|nr:TIGR02147 family protein [Fibrobacteria bacterium]